MENHTETGMKTGNEEIEKVAKNDWLSMLIL
jgi:hypothetical protein